MSPKIRNPVDQQVGARLRKHRLAFGMTQERLGKLTGVSFQQVQKYEKGINRIGSSRLQQFATILKVSPAFFFEDTVAATSNSNTNAYAYIDEFMSSRDGIALARAFQQIDDPKLRRSIVTMVEHIAEAKSIG